MTLRHITSKGIPALLLCFLFVLSGCEKQKANLISFDMQKLTPNPVIDSINPPDVAPSGVTEIVIQGHNFSADPADLAVYFNSVQATIRSSSADRITINRPAIVGESVTIKVVHKNAILPAQLSPYKLEAVYSVLDLVLPTQIVQGVDLDRDENLYINTLDGEFNRLMLKFPPDGQAFDMGLLRYTATDQKVGPGGFLYLFVGLQDIYRAPLAGGNAVKWAKVSKKPGFGDFDENGNLYVAGKKTDIFTVKTDASSIASGKYADYDVRCIRVFDGAVYNLAVYQGADSLTIPKTAVWKNRILSGEGQLGDNELVLNWALTGAYSGSIPYCITFSADGDMFIGTDNADPILILKSSGSMEPLYPTILFPTVYQLAWGNGNFLYANLRSSQKAKNIVRIDAGRPGAPSYGRNLN